MKEILYFSVTSIARRPLFSYLVSLFACFDSPGKKLYSYNQNKLYQGAEVSRFHQ